MTRFFPVEAYEQQAHAISPTQIGLSSAQQRGAGHVVFPGRLEDERALLTLRLGAHFAALDASRTPITLTQKKGRLMLAMLACGPDMRRSRDWLRRHLWHRSFTSHGLSSLRQCLHNLRLALGPCGECLCADRDFIWLESTRIDWAESEQDPTQFLKNSTWIEEPVKEWLDRERQRGAAGARGAAR